MTIRLAQSAAALVMSGLVAIAGPAAAQVAATAGDNPIETNQAFVEQLYRKPLLDISKVDQVFDHIFGQFPAEVMVYPTENYYYFKFYHGGMRYGGNFRLDSADRDQGNVHFAYFSEYNVFGQQDVSEHRVYNAELGVRVEQAGDLAYRVTRGDKTVTFRLNDLRHVKPAPEMVREEEDYFGPVFDESGIQFFLLWNRTQEMFLYVLDESSAPESLFESEHSVSIRVGARTGFAYYRDRYLDRWILIGVQAHESSINSYYDGPFDQLPDNFIEGDAFRDALVKVYPEVEGGIDRWGNSEDLTGRVLVDPYTFYSSDEELTSYDECAAQASTPDEYYPCFNVGQTR